MTIAPTVLVIGSANVDVSVTVERLPGRGETLLGRQSLVTVGGKGANQAVAARACATTTRFAGRVGNDTFGDMVLRDLRERDVATEALHIVERIPTGMATISVDAEGNNCIVVVPGANATLTPEVVPAFAEMISEAAVLVIQCEIPLDTVYRLIDAAAQAKTPVVLNPAPVGGLRAERLGAGVTYLVPNETEAAQLAGRSLESVDDFIIWAREMCYRGVSCVIVTLGTRGCLVVDLHTSEHIPALPVKAIDTTGAGDAFVGCFSASLAIGCSRAEALRRATLYAALSTTRSGAQASYPNDQEFETALRTA